MADNNGKQEAGTGVVRVDIWDGSAVKNTLDDSVRRVLVDKMGYIEYHRLMDMRLAICLTAVGAAMFALAWDYFNPFPESKPILVSCVISYFILMAILTIYTTVVEKGIFLEALDPKTGAKWTVSSSLKRFDDQYSVCLEYLSGSDGSQILDATLSKSVAEWFTDSGELLFEKFESQVSQIHNSLLKNESRKTK